MRKVMYRIYDCKEERYLPGLYQDKDMNTAIGMPKGYAYTYNSTGNKFAGRYRIEFYGEVNNVDASWCREWDQIRMKILGKNQKLSDRQ